MGLLGEAYIFIPKNKDNQMAKIKTKNEDSALDEILAENSSEMQGKFLIMLILEILLSTMHAAVNSSRAAFPEAVLLKLSDPRPLASLFWAIAS